MTRILRARSRRALALCLALSGTTFAADIKEATGSGYSLGPQVMGSGTARLQGGAWSLEGTAGQLDVATLAGGTIALDGGFWAAVNAESNGDRIFRSGFD